MRAVYIADRKLYDKLPTAINSLLSNNQEVDAIYLLIEDNNIPYITSPKVKFINLSNRNDIVKCGLNCTKRYPYPTIARCFLPSILPDEKMVLYLDVDTVIDGNLKELWNINLGANYAAARFESEGYFNSGVMLMNLSMIKIVENKLRNLLMNCKFAFPDQDAMNFVFKNSVVELPHKFNALGRSNVYDSQEIIIRHYAGVTKPWREAADEKDKEFWNKYKTDKLI